MRTLEGHVALVTGSSRGTGAAIATEFARRGAAVAVHGRDREAGGGGNFTPPALLEDIPEDAGGRPSTATCSPRSSRSRASCRA